VSNLVEQLKETTFEFTPAHTLLTLLATPATAESAIEDLIDTGTFSGDAIRTWVGDDGANVLDPDGSRHGTAARLWRAAQAATGERQMFERYALEVRRGRVCLGVRCETADDVTTAKAVLDRRRGYFMNHYHGGAIELLKE
jgi:hypothetical protein